MSTFHIRKHEWIYNVDGCGTEACKYCNSRAGIGFHYITECELRLNEAGFRDFLEFSNISPIPQSDGTYCKRFSTKTFTIEELLEKYESLCDPEEDEKVKNEKYICENKI